jgi:hypothetical protein
MNKEKKRLKKAEIKEQQKNVNLSSIKKRRREGHYRKIGDSL